LYGVAIFASGQINFSYLKSALTAKYGEIPQENKYIEKYYKDLKSGHLVFEYDEISESITLMLKSNVIFEEQQAFDKVRSQKGNEDLTGFRGLEWGSPRPADMIYLTTSDFYGGEQGYTRPSDALTIGGAELERITYNYWNNRLSSVYITASGLGNFKALKDALSAKYGELDLENVYVCYKLLSSGFLVLKYEKDSGPVSLLMRSNAISAEQEAFDKERAKRGKDDF
jgi:hypothetical protein